MAGALDERAEKKPPLIREQWEWANAMDRLADVFCAPYRIADTVLTFSGSAVDEDDDAEDGGLFV